MYLKAEKQGITQAASFYYRKEVIRLKQTIFSVSPWRRHGKATSHLTVRGTFSTRKSAYAIAARLTSPTLLHPRDYLVVTFAAKVINHKQEPMPPRAASLPELIARDIRLEDGNEDEGRAGFMTRGVTREFKASELCLRPYLNLPSFFCSFDNVLTSLNSRVTLSANSRDGVHCLNLTSVKKADYCLLTSVK